MGHGQPLYLILKNKIWHSKLSVEGVCMIVWLSGEILSILSEASGRGGVHLQDKIQGTLDVVYGPSQVRFVNILSRVCPLMQIQFLTHLSINFREQLSDYLSSFSLRTAMTAILITRLEIHGRQSYNWRHRSGSPVH